MQVAGLAKTRQLSGGEAVPSLMNAHPTRENTGPGSESLRCVSNERGRENSPGKKGLSPKKFGGCQNCCHFLNLFRPWNTIADSGAVGAGSMFMRRDCAQNCAQAEFGLVCFRCMRCRASPQKYKEIQPEPNRAKYLIPHATSTWAQGVMGSNLSPRPKFS